MAKRVLRRPIKNLLSEAMEEYPKASEEINEYPVARKKLEPMVVPPIPMNFPRVQENPQLEVEIQDSQYAFDSILQNLKFVWNQPMKIASVGRLAVDTAKVLEMRRKMLLMPSTYTESIKATSPKNDLIDADFEGLD